MTVSFSFVISYRSMRNAWLPFGGKGNGISALDVAFTRAVYAATRSWVGSQGLVVSFQADRPASDSRAQA